MFLPVLCVHTRKQGKKPALIASSCLHLTASLSLANNSVFVVSTQQIVYMRIMAHFQKVSPRRHSSCLMAHVKSDRNSCVKNEKESLSWMIQHALCLKQTEAFTSKPFVTCSKVFYVITASSGTAAWRQWVDPSLYWLTSVSLTFQPCGPFRGLIICIHLPSIDNLVKTPGFPKLPYMWYTYSFNMKMCIKWCTRDPVFSLWSNSAAIKSGILDLNIWLNVSIP